MKRHLNFYGRSVSEYIEVTDNRQDVILSGGDLALHIPLKTKEFPSGVYARAGANGDSRVRVQPGGSYETLRLFRKVGLGKPWSTSYNSPGTYTWRVPYTLSYRITVKGAGGGASGIEWGRGGDSENDYVVVGHGGKHGGNGESVAKVIALRAGDTYEIIVGRGGKNGEDEDGGVYVTKGTGGEGSRFADKIHASGGGGAVLRRWRKKDTTYYEDELGQDAGNGLGGRGGRISFEEDSWGNTRINRRYDAENGSVRVEAILL